jgi:hypothetical protein
MEIITFVPESIKENPYIADVAELIEARNAAAENGDNPLNVGTFYTWNADEAGKQKTAFAKAANLAGYTARKRHEEDITNEDGSKSVKVTFTLTSKHKDRRNKEREHAAKIDGGNGDDTSETANVDPEPTPDAPSNEAVEESTNDGEETAAETVESTPVARRPRKR